ncbi:MAG: Tex family protein [Planctomycetota bacterium]
MTTFDAVSELAAHVPQVVKELNLTAWQVVAAVELLDGGATVPFIARYRKEVTGGLDEVAVIGIRDRFSQLRELATRRAAVLKSLVEQGKLTDDLQAAVLGAGTMSALEDIYLPYRPKRRTRGMIAREKGLEPLAQAIFEQGELDPEAAAAAYVDAGKDVADAAAALAGARDIIAEWTNEDAPARAEIRRLFAAKGILQTRVIPGKEVEGAKFKDYFDWSEPIATAPSHRVLAIRRGEHENVLSFDIQPDPAEALAALRQRFVRGESPAARQVKAAVEDAYKRLMAPSIETDLRMDSKKRADEEAIRVFAENIRELLLSSPLGQKRVLAVDPGLRTGCKIVVLDEQGKLLHHDVIFPLEPMNRRDEAASMVKFLCQRYRIEAIAVGNGTGGRESEAFCRDLGLGEGVSVVSVNESGASVYSASEVAREEFADQDITVRGAVSIGRRLMDPLAELVKIDPKSIGVGQYQHDVDQSALKRSLDDTVGSCVNAVGVEVNTASKELLGYVSGLSSRLAGAIVAHRNAHGAFSSRTALMDVTGMGPKSFEQAAGFLRIRQSPNPLDASAVHPERYALVEAMAADVGCTVADLIADPARRERIEVKKYVTDTVGIPTLNDIMAELAKPGRDPRKQFEAFRFADGVRTVGDLQPGMKLPGIVTNVAAFGAFVDIGVHQDGLIHVSELADRFVKNASEVVKVLQRVTVTVMAIDAERNRISLSMRTNPGDRPAGGRSAPAASQPGKPAAKRPVPPRAAPQAGGWFTDLLKDKTKPGNP